MTMFSRALFLLCLSIFTLAPVSQTPRTYKIHDLENIQTVLKEVIEIQNIEKLQSDKFPEDFEIEVKNISKKPIYFVDIVVIFRGPALIGSIPIGFRVGFGDGKLIDIDNRPGPTDIPINPGETGILKPYPANVNSVRKFLENRLGSDNVENALSSVALSFQVISFGDGTGYIAGQAYPSKKGSQGFTR